LTALLTGLIHGSVREIRGAYIKEHCLSVKAICGRFGDGLAAVAIPAVSQVR
jgi:hypothetical protein